LRARLRAAKDLTDVNSDQEIKNPQVSIAIDRDKARAMGVSAQAFKPEHRRVLCRNRRRPNWLAY
jgi:multidrug efflux pump subunit AcrB